MDKIKRLWKILSGTVSWNLKAPDMSSAVMKNSKKSVKKNAHQSALKKGLPEQ